MHAVDEDVTRRTPDAAPRKRSFGAGAWPISPSALAALVDLGLPDEIIARYFMIEPSSVGLLRAHYAAGHAGPSSGEPAAG